MRKSLKEDWPLIGVFLVGGIGIVVCLLDFLFCQNPDLGFQVLSLPGLVLFGERFILNLFTPVGFIGLVGTILGGVLEMKGRLDLRKAGMTMFGSVRLEVVEGHTLRTEGIYRYIRHPMYLSGILQQGFLLMFSIIGVLFTPFVVVFFLFRIRIEERMLVEEFGDEYREYQKRTKKLIPFIY